MVNKLKGAILTIISIIVIILVSFGIISSTTSDTRVAAENISGSGLPLAQLFGFNSVVMLMFMAAILIMLIGVILAVLIKIKKE